MIIAMPFLIHANRTEEFIDIYNKSDIINSKDMNPIGDESMVIIWLDQQNGER